MARLRTFFDAYANALSTADIDGIADAYAGQFMAAGPSFQMPLTNDAQFRRGLEQAAKVYRQIGVDVVEVKNYLEAELGTGYWLTKVEWELLDEDLNTIITFDTTYFVEGVTKAKIVLFINHNEQQRLQDAGLIDE